MKLRVELELTDNQVRDLARKSHTLRMEPRRPWSMPEYKEHARIAVQRIVSESIKREQQT